MNFIKSENSIDKEGAIFIANSISKLKNLK
jgi:hypothetical protein